MAPPPNSFATKQITALRSDFDQAAGRSLSLPIAGAAVWTAIGATALVVDNETGTLVLLFGTGLIFPTALLIARVLGERLIDNPSPLAGLMGRSVLMVNLLWAVHLTVFAQRPEYLPLTLGIGLGLHWVVFSWIIGHRLGLVHAALRTVLVTALWWAMPGNRVSAVAAGVVLAYLYAIGSLAVRPLNTGDTALHGASTTS